MYIVKLSGGLGNQLFQIGFAFYLKKTSNSLVKIDLSFYSDQYNVLYGNYLKYRKVEKRKYEFINNSPFEICNQKELALVALGISDKTNKLNKFFINFICFLASIFSWTIMLKIFSKNIVNDLNFTSKIFEKKKLIFSGYWQEKSYFVELEHFIKISLQNALKNVNSNFFELTSNYNLNDYIVLHVRKGDYSFLNKYFDLDFVYYKNAVFHIQNINPCLNKLLIITNDTNWCLNNLQFDKFSIEFSKSSLYFDFSLMTNAKYIVTSNSTFGFWAAYLGEPIIATQPNLWYNDKEFGFKPNSWYSINCLNKV
jgi:hypothetical protein